LLTFLRVLAGIHALWLEAWLLVELLISVLSSAEVCLIFEELVKAIEIKEY